MSERPICPIRTRDSAAGRFETSDVAAWQGGELVLRRRVDHVINVRGRKVDPSEVEKVLAGARRRRRGGGHRRDLARTAATRSCARWWRAPSGASSYQHVAAWCRHRLADHKVPRSVVIVDAIPRTSRGKIDRAALLELANPEGSRRGRMADPAGGWRPSPFLTASAGLHGVALATLLASPRSWGLVLTAVVANHLAIAAAGLLPRCGWLGPNITRLPAPRPAASSWR